MFAGYRDEVTAEKYPLLCSSIIIIYRSSLSKTRPYYGFPVRSEKAVSFFRRFVSSPGFAHVLHALCALL